MTKNDYFRTFCKVSRAFGTTLDKDEILKLIVESVVDIMKGKAACLWLADEESNEFLPVAHKGLSKKYFQAPVHAEKIAAVARKEGYLYARDATKDPRLEYHETKKAEGIASILVVPVMVKRRLTGVLSVFTSKPKEFSKDEIEFLTALAEQGGMAIEHARLFEKIMENTRLFHNIAAHINSTLDVKKILQILSADVAKALGVKASAVLLIDKDKQTLELMASYGLSEKYLDRGPLSVEKSMSDTLKGEPVVIKDAASDKRVQYHKEKEEEGIVSILSVPIMAKEEVIGALRLYSAVAREFTEDEVMLVTALALQGGLAIQNASMYLMLEQDMKDLKDDLWSHRSWF
ncbi:MAG: GAF domain-containing protein [Desulfobacteraceae bacterium]|jgi:GAF domain-containing protein